MINFGTEFEAIYNMKKLLFLFSLFFILFCQGKDIHPYHVGSVEINYNSNTKTFEVSAKFFLDDLENALNKKYNKKINSKSQCLKRKQGNIFIKLYKKNGYD